MSTIAQDIRFALRNLRRTPAFPLAAIGTLALGIGATTAIFSTVNAVLLRPLPYPNSQDLYSLRTALTDGRVTTGFLAGSELYRLNDPRLSIQHAAGLQPFDLTLIRQDGTPMHAAVSGVTERFFDLFGLPMTLGGFTANQFTAQGPPVAVISYRIWREMFQSDPAIVGKPLRFAEFSTTIAGVAPKNFDTPHNADFWFSLRLNPQDVNHSLEGFIRLKHGATIERAQSEMSSVMTGLQKDFPASAKARIYVVRPMVEQIVGDLGPILVVVLSATALLLILACVNVTNLLLARGAARAREMAVRVALGANRTRIIRQLLTESVVLATAGTIVGWLVASAGVRMLLSIGASRLPRLDEVPFDGRVLLFALVALIVSAILVGFAPAIRLAGTDVKTLMNESSRSASGGRTTTRWLSAMTVAEIALAVTLVAGAGWLIRSFASLRAINPGFVPEKRLLFDMTLNGPKFRDATTGVATLTDLFGRLRAIPGVVSAGGTSSFPLRGAQENSLFAEFKGEAPDPARPMGTRQRFITPGFFQAAGIKLITGRDFTGDDRPGNAQVAIVNTMFAKKYLSGRSPIGIHVSFGYPTVNPQSESEIVGVVDDVRQKTLVDVAEPALYSPFGQGFARRLTAVIETRGTDTTALQASLRDEMRKFDPQVAVDFETVTDIVSSTLRRQELGMTLMLLFGAVAVALAAVGIYGVVAYAVAQRRGEVATRLALGASSINVFWLVLRRGCALAAAGTAIGLGVAYFSGRIVASHIYGVSGSDAIILGAATLIVAAIAVLATTIPAFRASRLQPAKELRAE